MLLRVPEGRTGVLSQSKRAVRKQNTESPFCVPFSSISTRKKPKSALNSIAKRESRGSKTLWRVKGSALASLQTRYENVKDRQGNYKREFAGYACSYRLKLAFDFDSKQLAKVISAIADCGAQPELSIAFTVKNPARVSEELLINATENARAKAEILCKASGSTLGQLLNIDYNWGELNVFSRTSYDVEDCIQPLMAMSKCAAPEIEPVDIDVTDTVAFTWEIQ